MYSFWLKISRRSILFYSWSQTEIAGTPSPSISGMLLLYCHFQETSLKSFVLVFFESNFILKLWSFCKGAIQIHLFYYSKWARNVMSTHIEKISKWPLDENDHVGYECVATSSDSALCWVNSLRSMLIYYGGMAYKGSCMT